MEKNNLMVAISARNVRVCSLSWVTPKRVIIHQMQETQRDASLDREHLADSVRGCEFPCCLVRVELCY